MASRQMSDRFRPRTAARRRRTILFLGLFLLAVLVGLVGLVSLLAQILWQGLPYLSINFLFDFPSRFADQAGIKPALFGTLWIMALTALFVVPVGVSSAIYLEEYAPKNLLTRLIEINISNLAGVPSIVYGLLGLAVFVQLLSMGRIIIAGALTMGLLVLPIVIIASREAIRAVPSTYREAAYGLGATRFQVVKGVVLPQAVPGILTGTILAMSRAIGEAAPMVAISALAFMTFTPTSPLDTFTVLPIQIFNWVQDPREGFSGIAAAAIIVLLVALLSMNAVAIYIRNRTQTRSEE